MGRDVHFPLLDIIWQVALMLPFTAGDVETAFAHANQIERVYFRNY